MGSSAMGDGLRRVIVVAGVVVAIALMVVAVNQSQDDPVAQVTNVSAVERLIPGRGDLAVRQAQVGIDLAPGYTGVLLVNGTEIPEDQIERVEPLNEMYFTPREGNEIEAFEPGEVCVTAIYWRIGADREAGDSTRWCFDVA